MSELDTFVALFMAMLAVAAIAGGAIYWIIAYKVKRDVMSLARAQHHRTMATLSTESGYGYWRDYEDTKRKGKKKIKKLNQAIKRTNGAYEYHARQLDEREPENEQLICWIRNNLAYYLAERKRCNKSEEGDDALAQECAKYIYKKISKYPEKKKDYTDTYHFVEKQFNNNP
jgi:hypothetical protein